MLRLFAWNVLCPALELSWAECKSRGITSSQCAGIPWGFPSDLTSHPGSNSNSVKREGDLSFGCLLPFAISGAKLSSDLLWSFPRLAQSPGPLGYWMEEMAHHDTDLFLDDYDADQNKDWLRSRLFLPCHPLIHIWDLLCAPGDFRWTMRWCKMTLIVSTYAPSRSSHRTWIM